VKRSVRLALAGLAGGLLVAGTSVAGAVLDRPPVTAPTASSSTAPTLEDVRRALGVGDDTPIAAASTSLDAGTTQLDGDDLPAAASATVRFSPTGRLPEGTFLVGAARASLAPAPSTYGGTWQTEGCTSLDDEQADPAAVDHTISDPRGWPASSPDCIYLGGFGIGPARPATSVDPGGVWVRSVAVSNGETLFTYSIADAVGWFARYDAALCGDCGILDVRERLAAEVLGDPSLVGNVIVASTHSHATADTYGGWGGIPSWYRSQLRDAAVASVKQAVANLQPATLATGEVDLRRRNNERRDTYYSTVDGGATWVQARTLASATCSGQGKKQTCTTSGGDVVATWAAFGAHATMVGDPILHADWPGAASRSFEATYGGIGLVFEGALGNSSVSGVGSVEATGKAIAGDVGRSIAGDDGHRLTANTMVAAAKVLTHPAMTNPGLVTLGSVGLFDREFVPGTPGGGVPGTYSWSKAGETSSAAGEDNDPGAKGEQVRSCVSSGPTVITTAGAHRIGDLQIAFAPGEIFGTIAEVVKERADGAATTMVLGQTNDALGYLIQSFEFDAQGNAVTEYGTTTGEYEEVFALDHCLGDHVLETMLEASDALGFGR
jgi:hypothetical protein